MRQPVCQSVAVRVPATSANLGSGFDTAGIALDYADEMLFTLQDSEAGDDVQVIIHGEGESTLPRDETHLVVSTFRKACERFGLPQLRFCLEATNRIPQARGMGSSASAIVAAVSAAWGFASASDLPRDDVFAFASTIEGHPDNVAPAVFGGLTFSWNMGDNNTDFHTIRYETSSNVHVSVLIPDCELSTQQARQALPELVPRMDALLNVSRMGLLPVAFAGLQENGCVHSTLSDNELLFAATQDALHQSYRAHLMPESWELMRMFRSHGLASTISGAGPCVLVCYACDGVEDAVPTYERKIEHLASWYLHEHWRVLHASIDTHGVSIVRS